MINKYTQEEINKILLSKNLSEFYFAIIEKRKGILSDEEYEDMLKGDITFQYGDNKKEIDDLYNKFQKNNCLKDFIPDLSKILYSIAEVRYLALLTVIGDDVYNACHAKFVDLKRDKIIRFDNLTDFYNETNSRLKYFTPEEDIRLTEKTVLFDVDDTSNFEFYNRKYIQQKENEDLTKDFLNEVKDKSYSLKYNKNND